MAAETPDSRADGPVRGRFGRSVLFVSAATLVIAAGVGVAAAASGDGGTPANRALAALTSTTAPDEKSGPGRADVKEKLRERLEKLDGKHGRFGPFGPGVGPGRGIRGEVVVPKSGGGYQTVAFQRGAVTAVSKTSLTVKSADGVSKTYAVDAGTIVVAARDGIASVKVQDQVMVTATVAGNTSTATRIADTSRLKEARKRWHPGKDGEPGQRGGRGAQDEHGN